MYLIETMRADEGDIPLWEWHRQRLLRSAEHLGWPPPALERPAMARGMVRLMAFPTGEVRFEMHPMPPHPEPYVVGISPVEVDPSDAWLYLKSSRRGPYERARAWAAEHGLADGLLVNAAGRVTESSIANLIVEIGGVRYTPPVHDGLLPGIQRAVLMEGSRLTERGFLPEDLAQADALYLCNAVRGVFPIVLAASVG